VRFHSGRVLHARDVVWSLARLRQEKGLEMAGYGIHVAEVEAVDEATVRVRTARPLSILLNKLRFVAIVPEGAGGDTLRAAADGTGPYRLSAWHPGARIELRRHDGYWGAAPAFEQVTLRLARSPEQAARDFQDGEADLVQSNSRAAAQALAAVPRARVERRPSLFVKYLAYDVADPASPFHRDEVRRALHVGLDRGRLVQALSVEAAPVSQAVPPTIFGFNPRLAPPAPDPERARALLARAGLPSGFATELHVRRLYTEAALEVQAQLRPLGIDVVVREWPDAEFLDRARRREFGFYLSRFGCPTGDASDMLENALHSTDLARRLGVQNYGRYSNPEVDAAIEQSAGIDAVAERRAALERILELVHRDLAWIPLFVDQDVYAVDRALRWEPRNDSFVLPAEVSAAR
jgi:peptide/nickel transport system substrate-binding protein